MLYARFIGTFDINACGRYASLADFDARKVIENIILSLNDALLMQLSYSCSAANSGQFGYLGKSPPEYDSTLGVYRY